MSSADLKKQWVTVLSLKRLQKTLSPSSSHSRGASCSPRAPGPQGKLSCRPPEPSRGRRSREHSACPRGSPGSRDTGRGGARKAQPGRARERKVPSGTRARAGIRAANEAPVWAERGGGAGRSAALAVAAAGAELGSR